MSIKTAYKEVGIVVMCAMMICLLVPLYMLYSIWWFMKSDKPRDDSR